MMFDRYRKMSPDEKLRRVAELSITCRQLAVEGIRHRFPDADDDEITVRWAATFLDGKTLIGMFGWDPNQ